MADLCMQHVPFAQNMLFKYAAYMQLWARDRNVKHKDQSDDNMTISQSQT